MTAPHLADATDPRFTDGQRAQLRRFEAAPAAPESFDPIAAIRRVEALADDAEDRHARYSNPLFGGFRFSATVTTPEIRAALAGDPR